MAVHNDVLSLERVLVAALAAVASAPTLVCLLCLRQVLL